ncbi:hypothetical protein AAF712_007386 [Marasmius tenuissimus]|uniref:Uncharacterized protein n=1 Tax=Marasmius tenuissimus TaxID=585030 RepID=A0ABR2ZW75_9AGAR
MGCFTGVVLRSEGVTAEQKQKLAAVKEKEKLKAAAAKRREKLKGKAGEAMETPGRATRSSSRKTINEDLMYIDDEDKDEDETAEDEEAADSTQLNLVPASQFSSFVLWHPDIPVDTGKDEYYGTISEWMKISHLVCFALVTSVALFS